MRGDVSPAGRFRAACGRKLSSRASLGGWEKVGSAPDGGKGDADDPFR